jgi:carbon storage regulator
LIVKSTVTRRHFNLISTEPEGRELAFKELPTVARKGHEMLVVTRRRRESILIRGDIRIEVISTRGSQVRLGIAAPADVAVDRQEVRELKKAKLGLKNGAPQPAQVQPEAPVLAGCKTV